MAEFALKTEQFKEFSNYFKSECNFIISCALLTVVKDCIQLNAYVFNGLRQQSIDECVRLLKKIFQKQTLKIKGVKLSILKKQYVMQIHFQ